MVTALEENRSMFKKWIYYLSVVAIVTFISYSFKPFQEEDHKWFLTGENETMLYQFPSLNTEDYEALSTEYSIPYTGKFFVGYKEALAFKESQGKYSKVNTYGYMGKYQFGSETLKSVGVYDSVAFMRSPKLQEKAFLALLSQNKWILKDEIEEYCGKVIGGILITESGILAAAHLGGPGSVKKFFRTRGKSQPRDKYGTSVKKFMRDFAGYETSAIVADSKAKVRT